MSSGDRGSSVLVVLWQWWWRGSVISGSGSGWARLVGALAYVW